MDERGKRGREDRRVHSVEGRPGTLRQIHREVSVVAGLVVDDRPERRLTENELQSHTPLTLHPDRGTPLHEATKDPGEAAEPLHATVGLQLIRTPPAANAATSIADHGHHLQCGKPNIDVPAPCS